MIKAVLETVLSHFICNVKYLAWPDPKGVLEAGVVCETFTIRLFHSLSFTGFNRRFRSDPEPPVDAPSLIPKRQWRSDQDKRRDTVNFVRLFRSEEVTIIYLSKEEDEVLRDLTRCRNFFLDLFVLL